MLIAPVVDRISPPYADGPEDDLDDLDESLDPRSLDEEDASERTPLVAKPPARPSMRQVSLQTLRSPMTIAYILGLLIALIKPVQRRVLGIYPEVPMGGWVWQSVGWALSVLGGVYVVLDVVRFGAHLREADTEM
jgi:predicted permease